MEFRRAADALVRAAASSSPMGPFKAARLRLPAARHHAHITGASQTSLSRVSTRSLHNGSLRSISSSSQTPQQATAAKESEEEDPEHHAVQPEKPARPAIDTLDAILSRSLGGDGALTRNNNALPSRTRASTTRGRGTSPADKLYEGAARKSRNDWMQGMNMPGQRGRPAPLAVSAAPPNLTPAPFRLNAALGRSIDMSAANRSDLARSLRTLERIVAANRVRADTNKQRFHERPGLRRKRLRSERWRRRFKADFQATVRRVQELKRKGW